LRLRLERAPGDWTDVTLLRKKLWLAAHQVEVGRKLWVDLEHVGVCGWADVLGLEPCPPLQKGEGWLITGTIRHNRGQVYQLKVEGEPEPIGVTEAHPFWSAEREAWVPVAALRVGERLLAEDGSMPPVLSLIRSGIEEPVYNIEVEEEHCYRVG